MDLQGTEMTFMVDLTLTDLETSSGDYGSFAAAVTAAVAGYAGPGSYAWDGTTLVWTARL